MSVPSPAPTAVMAGPPSVGTPAIRPLRPGAWAALLALADQRSPSGGHVHSGGVEQAVADGLVRTAPDLARLLERRVLSVGLVTAAICAAAVLAPPEHLPRLDAETTARTPSAPLRAASRAQGRGLLRTAVAAWPQGPGPDLAWPVLGPRPHHPIVLGCAARAAGADAPGAALVACYLAVTGPATAAQRLLALDPVEVTAVTMALNPLIEQVAEQATTSATDAAEAGTGFDPRGLPALADPLFDLLAQRHAERELTLFAS